MWILFSGIWKISIKKNGQKLCLESIPKWQVEKEEVESEKTEKNIKEATHEWTSVVGSNKKKLKQKRFLRKLLMDLSLFIMEVMGIQKQSRHLRQ